MSDEQQDKPGPSSGSGMTSRLASLRASIRASKVAKDEAETTEQDAATRQPTVSSPTAISSSQSIPVVEASVLDDDDDDELDGDFVADDTQISLSSDELTPQEDVQDDPPPRPFRDTGEKFNTDNLHRVRPSSEEPLDESSREMLAQMDQMSEAANEADAAGYEDPTIIQHIDDFAFVQGTPLYMSPEQCRSDPAKPATDVYSLGVMMFELLEGFPPYVAESVEEVLLMHQDAAIPEQRSQFTPPEVKDLVTRMLAKNPSERPSASEVIETLQRHAALGGEALGLEEESWSVSEIEESEPTQLPVAPVQVVPMQVVHRGEDHTIDSAPEDKLPPLWIVAVIGAVLLVGTIVVVTMSLGESTDTDPPDDPVVVADEPEPELELEPEPEPQPEPEVVDRPEPEPEVEPMEFGAADVDAGAPGSDAGSEADAGPSKEPVVEEAPQPKKKKKRRRKRRKKKPKKEELRELRLEL